MKDTVIKFRVWNVEEMIYLFSTGIQSFDYENGFVLSFSDEGYKGFYAHECYPETKVDFPVMQFSGLQDKNGKDIYEGDIIKDSLTGAVYEVKYGFCLKHCFTGWYCENIDRQVPINNDSGKTINSQIELIGNIYSNPELIER